jgi:thiol peroxidase
MATITLKGNAVHTSGNLPEVGSSISDFTLVGTDLSEVSLKSLGNKKKILNIFPSLDTPTCAMSVRRFNQEASSLSNVAVLNISMDLPFAMNRFCGNEGIKNAPALSAFRSNFAEQMGLKIVDGPLKGLCSRAVVILDENNKVLYREQVKEIADEPNYAEALKVIK